METCFKVDDEMRERFEALDTGRSMSSFAKQATIEKIKRMENRDARARAQLYEKDKAKLAPIIEDVLRMHGLMQ